MEPQNNISNEIANLKLELSSAHSDIGDWKVAKIMEYRAMGLDDPYNFEELSAKRQAVRDKINELQAQLGE